jgi:hypothetical protein
MNILGNPLGKASPPVSEFRDDSPAASLKSAGAWRFSKMQPRPSFSAPLHPNSVCDDDWLGREGGGGGSHEEEVESEGGARPLNN